MGPIELTLPSGARARVARGPGPGPVAEDRFERKRFFGARLLRAVEGDVVRVEVGEGSKAKRLDASEVEALHLPDYHALRDAAFRVGAIAMDDVERTCRNCDAPMPPRPDDAPLEDLVDWYVEEREDEDGDVAADGSLTVPLGEGLTLRMRRVTAREARPFFVEVLRGEGMRLTPDVVRAMGVVTDGRPSATLALVQRLDELPDELWARVTTAFALLAYSPRSTFPITCPSCGALHDVEAPPDREVSVAPGAYDAIVGGRSGGSPPGERAEVGPFPGEDAFAERALAIGREVYREMGVANVELEVSFDTPPVDGSGEPLLGSYTPQGELDEAGVEQPRFVIHVYHRTFARMYEDEPYDVDAELRDTIEHEVEHHLHHLRGHDPMDEEEREEAMRELTRTFGRRAIRRARLRGAVSETKSLLVLAVLVALALALAFTAWGRS